MTKVCPGCAEDKDANEYYFNGAVRNKMSHFCKTCMRALNKANWLKRKRNAQGKTA